MAHGAVTTRYRQERQAERAKQAFIDVRGRIAAMERWVEILALPEVTWKGRTLRTIHCHGTSGKGPHDCNVPEGLLWSLMSLDGFLCVYHAGDRS